MFSLVRGSIHVKGEKFSGSKKKSFACESHRVPISRAPCAPFFGTKKGTLCTLSKSSSGGFRESFVQWVFRHPVHLRYLFRHPVHLRYQGCCARMLCKDAVQGCCARMLCKDAVQGCCARMLCKDAVQGCCARMLCKDAVQGCCARMLCKVFFFFFFFFFFWVLFNLALGSLFFYLHPVTEGVLTSQASM